jgi:hypothetical protein
MDKVRFVVLYGGEWSNNGGKFKYQFGMCKVISVSRETTYQSLHDIISRLVEANPSESSIKMKFIFNSPEVLAPFEVLNDDDVQVFLCENSDVNTRTSLCVTIERKRRIIPNTQVPDNELVNEDIANVFESDNGNGVGLDNIHESLSSPNDFQNANVFSIGVDNDDEARDSRPSTSEVPSGRSRVASSQGIGIKSSTIHGSYTSLESVVNNVKEVGVGDLFPSKEELQMKMQLLSIANHFQFKVKKSTKTLLVMSCIVEDTKWRVRATKLNDCESFRVRKYSPDHTCSLDALHFDHRQASSKLIGHCIKSKFEGTSQSYRPNDIIDDMKKQCGMTLGYNKAWRAREIALGLARGSPDESFTILPSYCHMLEMKNPGMVTFIDIDALNRFKYFFMALGPSIEGFKSCIRPVVAVDGTFLKCKHQGTLFIATSLDGNNQVYPLAFGIGDSENDQSWHWFFTKLHGLIGEISDLVFISDRNSSIAKAAAGVFPNSLHGICMYHLGQNMKAKFKGVEVHDIFYKCSKAYRVVEFNQIMRQIRGIDASVAQYLNEADPTKWARSHFDGRRYCIMTTNIAECLNGILKDARELPITKLVEHIRGLLQKWFWERREAAAKMSTPMTKWAEKRLRRRSNKSRCYRVHPINLYEHHVVDGYLNGFVNLIEKTCTCRKFQLDQLPCRHALAACNLRRSSCYDFCSHYYHKETLATAYGSSIYPVGPMEEWDVPDDVQTRVVLPPKGRKPRGRPAKKRKPSKGEEIVQQKCGRCGGIGHNRQKCKAPIPLSDQNGNP